MTFKKSILGFYKKFTKGVLKKRLVPEFYFFKVLNNFIISVLTPRYVITGGKKIFIDPLDSLKLSKHRTYEPFTTDIAVKNIKAGDTVIDIGANIGYFTMYFAEAAGRNGKVFSFEPDSRNFKLLRKNISVNGFKNVAAEQKAVAGTTEKLKLFLSMRSRGHHRLFAPNDSGRSVEVNCVSLDEYFVNQDLKIDLIKMDIEGAEPAAIVGMKTILQKNHGVKIISEFNPAAIYSAGFSPEDYLNSIIKLKFKIFNIDEKNKLLEETSPADLSAKFNASNGRYTNLLLKRE